MLTTCLIASVSWADTATSLESAALKLMADTHTEKLVEHTGVASGPWALSGTGHLLSVLVASGLGMKRLSAQMAAHHRAQQAQRRAHL